MGRYNFVSPGAAAGDALVDQLTKQREEARQQMIDEITRQNAEQQRKASEEAVKASEQRREMTTLEAAKAGLEGGEEIGPDNPNYGIFQKYGLLGANPNPQPSVSTETDFGPDAEKLLESEPQAPRPENNNFYRGDPEHRKRERISKTLGDLHPGSLMDALSQEGVPDWQRMAALAGVMEQDVPSGFFSQSMRSDNQAYTIDNNTGKLAPATDPVTKKPITVPPGTNPIVRFGERPLTPSNGQPYFYSGPGGAPGGLSWDPRTKTWSKVDLPPDVTTTPTRPPTATSKTVPIVTDQVAAHIDQLIKAAEAPNATQAQKDAVYGAMVSAIAGANVLNKSIKDSAIYFLQKGDPRPAEQIGMDILANDPNATKEEVSQFVELLRRVRKF